MNRRIAHRPIPRFLTRLFVVAGLAGALVPLGCTAEDRPQIPSRIPAVSLLETVPYIDDETETRNPPPETSRLLIDEESVEGWPVPTEGVLRFPITLNSNAWLTFRLGISGDSQASHGDLIFKAQYRERTDGNIFSSPSSIFETSLWRNSSLVDSWTQVDLPLPIDGSSEGEILFAVDGRLSDHPGIEILWGATAVYYPDDSPTRNVLLIGVDTLRADGLTVYGGRDGLTPNLDAFAADSTVFTQARSQSSWTLPSFASMITGGLPTIIGTTFHSGRIPDSSTTLGEILREYGYATSTICANSYLGNNQSGFHQGMDELWFRYSATPQESVEQTLNFISRSTDRDWFCFLHFIDPHGPYTPPQHLADRFCDPGYTGSIGNVFHGGQEWKSAETVPPLDDITRARDLYDAEVASVDAAIGDLFDFLKSNGLMDNTLILFASDHGEEFFEHGRFEHGHTQYDEMVRLPLIVGGPGFSNCETIDTCVGNTDIVPTILRFFEVPLPNDLAGVPLQDVVTGSTGNDRIIFGEGNSRGNHRKFAVRWPFKCILDYVTGDARLYDLENDPGETVDISESEPEVTARLSEAMTLAMLPGRSMFHIWILGGLNEPPRRFSGTIRLSSGIESEQVWGLEDGDIYVVEDNTITFDILNTVTEQGIDKHFTIVPLTEDVTLEATVRVDGRIDPNLFHPYGTLSPEPSGYAAVSLEDFPIGARMPIGDERLPPAMYIWGVRGIHLQEMQQEFDPETLEQLRSLGYI